MNNTIIIPIGSHCIILNADFRDITTTEEYDPADDLTYQSVHLLGRWLQYAYGEPLEAIAKGLSGRMVYWSCSDEEYAEMKAKVTPEMHKRAVELLRGIYAEIVCKLSADIQHNLFRAHHQGIYQNFYDRSAVVRAIELWLVGIKETMIQYAK